MVQFAQFSFHQSHSWCLWPKLESLPDTTDAILLQMIFHLLLLSWFGLKAQFFSFGRAFISGLIPGLLLEKHRNNLGGYGILPTKVDIVCYCVWKGVNILPVSTSEPSLYHGSLLAACVPEVCAEVARSQMKRLMAPPPCRADHFLFSFRNPFKVIGESQRGQFLQTIAK